MNNDNNIAIEAKGLNKSYKQKDGKENIALVDFNIKIPKGITYGLLGPNGAGKSTFINILGGLVLKNSGYVNICGIDNVIYKRYFSVPFVSDKKRKKFLEDVKKTASNL